MSLFSQEVLCNEKVGLPGKSDWRVLICHADSSIKHVVISYLYPFIFHRGEENASVWDKFGKGKQVCDRTPLSAKMPAVMKAWMMLKGKSKPKQDYTDLPSL